MVLVTGFNMVLQSFMMQPNSIVLFSPTQFLVYKSSGPGARDTYVYTAANLKFKNCRLARWAGPLRNGEVKFRAAGLTSSYRTLRGCPATLNPMSASSQFFKELSIRQ